MSCSDGAGKQPQPILNLVRFNCRPTKTHLVCITAVSIAILALNVTKLLFSNNLLSRGKNC